MKVLLVDDEKFAIEGLKKMLQWESFDGVLAGTASNGKEAYELALAVHPDVIISDIKMPVMDGLALAEMIASSRRSIQIILLSAHDDFEYAQRAISFGVSRYVLKPVTREKINQLQQYLVDLNRQLTESKKQYLTAWDSSLQEQIMEAFRLNDRTFFDHFFHSEAFRDGMSHTVCNPTGIQLINYLYLYLAEINVKKEVLADSKKNTMTSYLDLPSREEKINYLIAKYYDVLESISMESSSNSSALSTAALTYVESEFADPDFNITYLADKLHVSISYLSTLFKQTTGGNLSDYIISLRMQKARELLETFELSISDISTACGYPDAKYFARLFKKKTGMTPSEYRNLITRSRTIL